MEVLYAVQLEDLDLSDVSFSCPDLNSFCRLDTLGLTVIGQHVDDDRAVLACRVSEGDQWCRDCGAEGNYRDTVERRLAHVPLGWRPTTLAVRVRRYTCTGCGRLWRQDTGLAAEPRSKLSRHGVVWALRALVIDRLSVARIAGTLGVSWHTANTAVLAAGRRLLINDPRRFDGVTVIGVDEHCWRHPRAGAKLERFVTVIIDLTPVRDKTGLARLLDLVEGRSKAAFTDPLYGIRRALLTGADLLTDKQKTRLNTVFDQAKHISVEATWAVYQRLVAAYRDPDRGKGKTVLTPVITSIRRGVPAGLGELQTLGRTLNRRADDLLAYFDRPGTSNGPTEAINGRLEHLRGIALGFRNLTNYTRRALLDTGGFRTPPTPSFAMSQLTRVLVPALASRSAPALATELLPPDRASDPASCTTGFRGRRKAGAGA